MQMLYNSDSYAVVLFEVGSDATPADASSTISAEPKRGGYEIVDKFARKEIFLEGAMAQHFKEGVEALIKNSPSQEELDEYIGRFTQLAQQPVVLH